MADDTENNRQLDDALAAFADQLLDGDEAQEAYADDPELAALQSVVARLHSGLGRSKPDPNLVARARKNLLTHWQSQQRKSRINLSGLGQRPAVRIVVGGLAVLLLVFSVVLAGGSSGGGGLPGSAGGGQFGSSAALVPMIVGGFMLWWVARQR